jgi:hypothetical protein
MSVPRVGVVDIVIRTVLLVLMWLTSAATPAIRDHQHCRSASIAPRERGDRGRRWNTWATLDIVQSEFADPGVELEEKRERLSNATCSTEHGDFRSLDWTMVSMVSDLYSMRGAFSRKTDLASRSREGSPLNSTENLTGKHDGDDGWERRGWIEQMGGRMSWDDGYQGQL